MPHPHNCLCPLCVRADDFDDEAAELYGPPPPAERYPWSTPEQRAEWIDAASEQSLEELFRILRNPYSATCALWAGDPDLIRDVLRIKSAQMAVV